MWCPSLGHMLPWTKRAKGGVPLWMFLTLSLYVAIPFSHWVYMNGGLNNPLVLVWWIADFFEHTIIQTEIGDLVFSSESNQWWSPLWLVVSAFASTSLGSLKTCFNLTDALTCSEPPTKYGTSWYFWECSIGTMSQWHSSLPSKATVAQPRYLKL